MANVEINDLTGKTTPVSTDEVEIQETAGGTSKKATLGNVSKAITITESQISDLGTYSTATGVENNADVTDATNVTAAGALMDSEVTNLAQVKAFDTTDYATALQGSNSDSHIASTANPHSVDETDILPTQTANSGKYLTTNGTASSWATLAGGGDMSASTYDPATISEQLVGLTATQTLTNKTIDASNNTVSNIGNSQLNTTAGNIGGAWLTWTPTYTDFTVGNGTLSYAKYTLIGKTVHFRYKYIVGSTDTEPTAAFQVSLPLTMHSDYSDNLESFGIVSFQDASEGKIYMGVATPDGALTLCRPKMLNDSGGTYEVVGGDANTNLDTNTPVAMAAGDTIMIEGTYESA